MCDVADGLNVIDRTVTRHARKDHACTGCGETISIGHVYHYTVTLYDGNFQQWKHCARCRTIYAAILKRSDRMTYVDPALNCGETWESAFGEDPPDEIEALAFALPGDPP